MDKSTRESFLLGSVLDTFIGQYPNKVAPYKICNNFCLSTQLYGHTQDLGDEVHSEDDLRAGDLRPY